MEIYFSIVKTNHSSKVESIQMLRAIAITLVVINHISNYFARNFGFKPYFLSWGQCGECGVDLFFVISGFVIMYISIINKREISPVSFVLHRVGRIYPLYWIVSLIYLPLFLVVPSLLNRGSDGVLAVSLWKSFLLIPSNLAPLIGQGWTLVYEMYFYIIFTLMLLNPKRIILMLSGWATALGISACFLGGRHIFFTNDVVSGYISPYLHLITDMQSFEFIGGCFVAVIVFSKFRFSQNLGFYSLIIGIAILLINFYKLNYYNRVFVYGIPFILIVYGLVSLEKNGKLIVPNFLKVIGDSSYSVYLVHLLVLSAVFKLLHKVAPFAYKSTLLSLIISFSCLFLCLVIGKYLYQYVERPILGSSRNIIRHLLIRFDLNH